MQFPAMLSESLPEERKPISDVGKESLFLGEGKTTLCQELFHRWFDFFFQQASGFTCDNEKAEWHWWKNAVFWALCLYVAKSDGVINRSVSSNGRFGC